MSTTAVPPAAPKGSPLGRIVGLTVLLGLSVLLYRWVWIDGVRPGWADAIAFSVTLICLASGARLLVESFDRKALGARMEVEGDPTVRETGQVRLQALMVILLGVTMAVPPVIALSGQGVPVAAYAAVVAVMVLRMYYNWRVMTRADEFLRRRVQEAHSILLMILSPALTLYAAAERLGLAPQASAWELVVLLTLATLVTPLIIRARLNRAAD